MDDSTLTQRVSYKAKSTEISIRIEKTEENTIRVVNLHKRRAEPAREKRSIKKGPTEKPAVTEDTKKTSVKISSPYIKTEYLRMLKLESSEIQDDSRASVSTNFSPEGLNPSFHPEIKTLKKHKCHICNASFNKRYSLIRHHMVHSGERPFMCQECGKTFIQKSDCQRHATIHGDEYNFVCDAAGCGRAFRTKKNLQSHVYVHCSDRPFVCEVCGNTFKLKSCLKLHCDRHACYEDSKFQCQVEGCFKAFPSLHYLKSHMTCHSAARDFTCPTCPSAFKRKNDLTYHISYIHGL